MSSSNMKAIFAAVFLCACLVFVGLKSYNALPFLHGNDASAAGVPENLSKLILPSTQSLADLRKEVSLNIDAVTSVTGQNIRLLFGEPDLILSELPTTIWQFQNKNCTLNLFFVHGGYDVLSQTVSDYNLRARQVGGDVSRCLPDMVSARRGGGFTGLVGL